ncbi:hypothetical protein B0H16DRAFT_1856621 [Mycena metata]|uniref:Uncharacterized protein n=1 Tax=Mycena metata TaxID=1033252 RepID=A0AAD7ILS1_9AGAR|nr:hypothetical protein B0H16DRAFT_1856621 [Mycena metata]
MARAADANDQTERTETVDWWRMKRRRKMTAEAGRGAGASGTEEQGQIRGADRDVRVVRVKVQSVHNATPRRQLEIATEEFRKQRHETLEVTGIGMAEDDTAVRRVGSAKGIREKNGGKKPKGLRRGQRESAAPAALCRPGAAVGAAVYRQLREFGMKTVAGRLFNSLGSLKVYHGGTLGAAKSVVGGGNFFQGAAQGATVGRQWGGNGSGRGRQLGRQCSCVTGAAICHTGRQWGGNGGLQALKLTLSLRRDIIVDSDEDELAPRRKRKRIPGRILDSKSDDGKPRRKRKGSKYVPKPTPPGVRRSTRLAK